MNLYIDTTKPLQITIGLDDQRLVKEYSSPQEQNVLQAIDEVLKKNNKELSALTSITVNQGPGSFTGTRVGVAIANALSFSLNIPVNNQKPPVEPNYDQEPHITKPK